MKKGCISIAAIFLAIVFILSSCGVSGVDNDEELRALLSGNCETELRISSPEADLCVAVKTENGSVCAKVLSPESIAGVSFVSAVGSEFSIEFSDISCDMHGFMPIFSVFLPQNIFPAGTEASFGSNGIKLTAGNASFELDQNGTPLRGEFGDLSCVYVSYYPT